MSVKTYTGNTSVNAETRFLTETLAEAVLVGSHKVSVHHPEHLSNSQLWHKILSFKLNKT